MKRREKNATRGRPRLDTEPLRSFSVTLSPDMIEALRDVAHEKRVTVSHFVRDTLEAAVRRAKRLSV